MPIKAQKPKKMENIKNIITSKWGQPGASKVGRKTFNKPKYARFRMKVQYNNGSAYYYSYDYTPIKKQGYVIRKDRSEVLALAKLMEMIEKKSGYRYANLYCNVTADLDTDKNNFNLLLCTITNTSINWKNVPIWSTSNEQMLDISKMKEYEI